MRYFVAVLVGAATFATAVASVRLHLSVAQLRYRLWSLEEESRRTERELRFAGAELEAAKAPRRLMDRWRALREGTPVAPAPKAPPVVEAPSAEELALVEAESAADVEAAERLLPPAPPPPAAPEVPEDVEGGR